MPLCRICLICRAVSLHFDLVKKSRLGRVFLLRDRAEEFLRIAVGVIKAALSFLFIAIRQPAAISVPARFTVKCLVTRTLISLLGRLDMHLKLSGFVVVVVKSTRMP